MAISKRQPMRSAEIDLVDAVNGLEQTTQTHTQSINTLAEGLANEIGNRERAITGVMNSLEAETIARQGADTALQNQIGEGFSTEQTIAQSLSATRDAITALEQADAALQAFQNKFNIGIVDSIEIPANTSVSSTVTFNTPFDETASCAIFAQVITNELATLFTYNLIDCTYSGFSYSISNNDADAHTVSLGYVAVKVN